jgi:hypothetical protein
MVIESLAASSTIDSKKLGWKKIALDGEPFVAANVPAGEQKLTFCNPDKCMDFRVRVRERDVTALLVDFAASSVLDVSLLRKNQWARWRDACEKGADRPSCQRACNTDVALSPLARSTACEAIGVPLQEPAPSTLVDIAGAFEIPCTANAGGRRGWLTIKTEPYSELFVGEKTLGTTPISRVELPAGCVEIKAVSREKNLEKVLRVEVEPDQVTVYSVQL